MGCTHEPPEEDQFLGSGAEQLQSQTTSAVGVAINVVSDGKGQRRVDLAMPERQVRCASPLEP